MLLSRFQYGMGHKPQNGHPVLQEECRFVLGMASVQAVNPLKRVSALALSVPHEDFTCMA